MTFISSIVWDEESYNKIHSIPKKQRSKFIRERIKRDTLPSIGDILIALDNKEFTLEELLDYSERLHKIALREKGG